MKKTWMQQSESCDRLSHNLVVKICFTNSVLSLPDLTEAIKYWMELPEYIFLVQDSSLAE